MILKEEFRIAIANMIANKTRSLFSMLGIVIGTGSVVLVISLVNGTRETVLERSRAGNEGVLQMFAKYDTQTGRYGSLTMPDIETIQKLDHVQRAYPKLSGDIDEVRGTVGRSKATLSGTDAINLHSYNLQMVNGRFFSESETDESPRICVISDKLVGPLFGFDDPIGQRLRCQQQTFEVIGVFQWDDRLKRLEVGNILVPYRTLFNMQGQRTVYSVVVHPKPDKVDEAKAELSAWKAHLAHPNALEIHDPRDDEKAIEKWAKLWLLQMTLVSGISLFVGGIGLMNVMLTTVAERTHEIGLRKALGADSRAVLMQFLIESATLSTVGGLIGVLLGVFLSYGAEVLSKGKLFVSVPPLAIVGSVAFSVLTGILFGLYPASNAARLSPVEALRYE